ncbi:MAG: hypothetical protein DRR06_19365, partial [Gammaproteobacteria bacterium]
MARIGDCVKGLSAAEESRQSWELKPTWRKVIEGGIGAIVGWAVAGYFEFSVILVPGIALVVSWAIFANLLRGPRRFFSLLSALQTTQILWFTFGLIATQQWLVLIDIVIPAILL